MSQIPPPVVSYETWITAIASSACIGCTSLVPWAFNLTFFEQQKQSVEGCQTGGNRMKYLLSFAIGAILGDIFFHLMPESYQSHQIELKISEREAHKKVGISIIAGIFMFVIVEMLLEKWSNSIGGDNSELEEQITQAKGDPQECNKSSQTSLGSNGFHKQDLTLLGADFVKKQYVDDRLIPETNNNDSVLTNLNQYVDQHSSVERNSYLKDDLCTTLYNNNNISPRNQNLRPRKLTDNAIIPKIKKSLGTEPIVKKHSNSSTVEKVKDPKTQTKLIPIIDTAGYLSLIANGFDNFTHGLAIGASFLVGLKVGLLTTFVIIIHEIPHEICDYAILVNSGFSRLDAVKAQSSVSLLGILGTATALYVKSMDILNSSTIWILPFSSGGFLYIALVNLLPDILDRETDISNTLKQVACVILGISFMASVALIDF